LRILFLSRNGLRLKTLPCILRPRPLKHGLAGENEGTLTGNRSFTVKEKKDMTEVEDKPKTSKMKTIIYIILGLILLTIFLELSGLADVAGKRETETIINRPHQ
jgi:hypothetical protein